MYAYKITQEFKGRSLILPSPIAKRLKGKIVEAVLLAIEEDDVPISAIAGLASRSRSFNFLVSEPDLYTVNDLRRHRR